MDGLNCEGSLIKQIRFVVAYKLVRQDESSEGAKYFMYVSRRQYKIISYDVEDFSFQIKLVSFPSLDNYRRYIYVCLYIC